MLRLTIILNYLDFSPQATTEVYSFIHTLCDAPTLLIIVKTN